METLSQNEVSRMSTTDLVDKLRELIYDTEIPPESNPLTRVRNLAVITCALTLHIDNAERRCAVQGEEIALLQKRLGTLEAQVKEHEAYMDNLSDSALRHAGLLNAIAARVVNHS